MKASLGAALGVPHDDEQRRVRGQDHVRRDRDDLSGRGDPVDLRHPDVHQDHVRLQPPDLLDGDPPVGGFADDVHSRVAGEDRFEAGAHQRVVVDEQDANRRGHDASR